ncbi:hypothetical protein CEJ39_17160 [Rhodococcus pyridinivorans]|uniref:hypothetical protein n=1 Tax=Rhodococcus pyridinivorans TaxID=103816 RepID=UPI000306DC9F|nr:hypothetical protein [Rhodococcus pyridinivorans]AWZ25664.1 hypothetical protein CEJ39_17160 [Rhodococcus pyridinivorans]UGQ59881.1 hypothetical protein LSF60_10625 [Rhodococcus pyridinivorans]
MIDYPALARTTIDTYQSRLEDIRTDRNLSDEGKSAKITALFDQSKAKIDGYRDKYINARRKRRDALQRELFGRATDSNVLAYRDAHDRVARLAALSTTQSAQALAEAHTMLRQAEISGDELLVKAIAATAYAEGWDSVLNAYITNHPETADKFAELVNISAGLDAQDIFGDWDNMSAFDLVVPREYTGVRPAGAAIL